LNWLGHATQYGFQRSQVQILAGMIK